MGINHIYFLIFEIIQNKIDDSVCALPVTNDAFCIQQNYESSSSAQPHLMVTNYLTFKININNFGHSARGRVCVVWR